MSTEPINVGITTAAATNQGLIEFLGPAVKETVALLIIGCSNGFRHRLSKTLTPCGSIAILDGESVVTTSSWSAS